ncbi:CST complex subunit STN1 isoform X2 [Apodemus sylvaticus]|uniref:CST complex subunit STN1 isoform X2 n=1 Tax=Apodemus sylvaticus TaxID=10129 RepID=UPI00224292C7|nr:CST complex subunit STN1 isoform X2 [Apodemus sylvaticus]
MPQPLMQCESSLREEEIPPLFWGLDPIFLAFAKLYIKDILEMKESQQMPGTYFYNGHPIRRVDIMGAVVSVRERETFYSYGDPAILSTGREFSMTSQLKKLQETIEQKTKIGIGDVIRVRGSVRMFRGEREICATIYYKVDDPVWNMQIARMLELPELYKKVYDQPFRNPALKEEEALNNKDTLDLAGLTSLLSEKVKEFLHEKKVQSFYQQELEMVESLQALASQPVTHSTCSDQVESKNNTTPGTAQSVFKNALQMLQEKGLVFQRDSGSDKLYYVTTKDKDLHQKIYQIIKEDCQKPNHIEKGCHLLHILNCVHLNLRWDLSKAVLQQVLELLEDQSDIVSTADHYYAAF